MEEHFVSFVIRDFIGKALETLWRYTDNSIFRVFVFDQTLNDEAYSKYHKMTHLWIKSFRNLGFAKGANEMLWTGYRQGYPYLAVCNDDIEYMHKDWWPALKSEFETYPTAMVVGPESPRVPLWGYGRP